MNTYHKIQTVFMRDPETRFKTLLEGQFSLPVFEYLQHNTWVFTEKVYGTNIRIQFKNGELIFAGKTDSAQLPPFLLSRLEEVFLPLMPTFNQLFEGADVCLYGEGYGDKIQKVGKLYRADQDFVLFDVRIGELWLERHNVEDIAEKLGLDIVPVIGKGTLHDMVAKTRAGFNSLWGDFKAEGIVARPATELLDRNGHRVITKIKYRDFA